MTIDDFKAFCEVLDGYWAMKGQVMAAAGRAAFFEQLQDYPLREVLYGMKAHFSDSVNGRFLPMPADVIAQIKRAVADDGRPGPEEAWAQVRRADNEAVTLVWTTEMAEAFGVARPLLEDRGGDVSARMAFKEAYTRLVEEARAARRPVSWSVSLGTDKTMRNSALLPHVQAGRIGAELLIEHSPVQGLDGLLALPAPEGATQATLDARAKALAELREVRQSIATQPTAREKRLAAMEQAAREDRQRTQELKADAAALVEQHQSSEE